MSLIVRYSMFGGLVLLLSQCKQPYTPPTQGGNHSYLVVDGVLVNGQDSTVIRLSRSANLGDTTKPPPELHAQVTVQGQGSGSYTLSELGGGAYGISQLSLDTSQPYRIMIQTSDGSQFASDWVPVLSTPPIDSLHWRVDSAGVSIFINTHGPDNNRYYRWQYVETWEYHSHFYSDLEFQGDSIVGRPLQDQVFKCWGYAGSTEILVTNTARLNQNIVNEFPLTIVPQASQQFSWVFSILAEQYSITEDAYNYWENLKLNTELKGSIFDAQPSEITGNLHNLSHPAEPVFGYLSACTRTTSRIYIANWNLQSGYSFYIPDDECSSWTPAPDSIAYYSRYSAIYTPFSNNGFTNLTWRFCADCTYYGGSNQKPSYWPY